MNRLLVLFLFITLIGVNKLYAQSNQTNYVFFQNLFTHWTNAFNQKRLDESCNLFSRSVTADYRETPTKNYSTICNGFKKIFKEKNKKYIYRFKILHVYRSGNLAVVRIRWYLDVFSNNQIVAVTQDEGMDVLQKSEDGEWKIINYLAYAK